MTPEQMRRVGVALRTRYPVPDPSLPIEVYQKHEIMRELSWAITDVANSETADHTLEVALPENDNVNHPAHYTAYKDIEVIQLTEQMNFNRGNAVKYIARAGLKNKDAEVEDLRKAVWYLEREIARIENG